MSASADIVAGLFVGLPSTALAAVTFVTSRRMKRQVAQQRQQATALKVDGDAYDRAQRFNKDIVKDLEHQIERLEKRADAADARSEAAEARSDAAERRARAAEERAAECAREVVSLRRTIRGMAREMQHQGMQPPPEATQE